MKNYTNHNTHGSDYIKNSPMTTALSTKTTGNFISINSNVKEKIDLKTKFYILNNINNQGENQSSGGVEAFNNIYFSNLKCCTIRLSISPSQGDDPGFKSRPEHLYLEKKENHIEFNKKIKKMICQSIKIYDFAIKFCLLWMQIF